MKNESESMSKLKQLAKQIQEDPDDSFSKFALALEFVKMDQYDKARVLFESIRRSEPDYVGVYYHLGKVYRLMGMNQRAKNCYQEGIEIAGNMENEERTLSELKEALADLRAEINS